MRPETDLKHLRNKLVGLLNDDKFDVKRSFDLQMVTVLTTFMLLVSLFCWSSGILDCIYLHLKIEFRSCAMGGQWCGIFHYH